jgi:Ca2+-binding RTX toxin-like protein
MRRSSIALAVLSLALLAASGAALAADGWPARTDEWVTTETDTADDIRLTNFWLTLNDGHADQVTVSPAMEGVNERWLLKMPEGRRVYGRPTGLCETPGFLLPDGRLVNCRRYVRLNLRMGDLVDTFVAGDLAAILNINGQDGNDYIRTAKGKDNLWGGNGNDVLRAGSGNDALFGESADDILDGGGGADAMDCGDGTDVIEYQGRTSPLTITLDGVANDGETGENDSIAANCENVESWNGADKIVGSSGPNRLSARDANDTLKGGGGNDRLYGGSGNDTLSGESGNDYLSGEAGDDTITGQSGTDTVYGGDGNDTINVKDGARDVVYCGGGAYDSVVYDVGLDEIDIGTCERRN